MATALSGTDALGAGLGGILSLIQGLSSGPYGAVPQAQQAAAVADPMMAARQQYQGQLSDLLNNPDSFKTDPGYEFALTQGQNAIKGNAGAMYGGTAGLGGLNPELAKFTEGYASQNYDNRINQLMHLAGTDSSSPAEAGRILAGGYQQQSSDLSGGIAGLLNGLGGLLNGLGSGGLTPGVTINNTNSGGNSSSSNVPSTYNDIPYGGTGPYDLTGTGPNSLYSLLGLGSATSGANPLLGFQQPGGVNGLFGTNSVLAQQLSNLLGYTNAPNGNAQPSTGTPGFPSGGSAGSAAAPALGSLFGGSQGGGLAALFGPNGPLSSYAPGYANQSPTEGWTSGSDLPGGGDGTIDWNALFSGSGSGGIDWNSFFSDAGSGGFDWGSLFGG
jgi:hypothetical protein